jgi:DNA-binding NarL/FixJ family response regulator
MGAGFYLNYLYKPMPVKVLIYEDNSNLRRSIETLLEWNNEYDVVAAMPHAASAKEDVAIFKPDVILMDIDMPGSNGVQAVKSIRTTNSAVIIIMFTVFDDNDNIFNAICAGANGYLLKKNVELLGDAIKDALAGGAPMTSSVAKKVLGMVPKNKVAVSTETDNLTSREVEILEYIVKGYSYKMVAQQLEIAVETVRSHLKKIYKKLQVSSATGAAYKYANRNQG